MCYFHPKIASVKLLKTPPKAMEWGWAPPLFFVMASLSSSMSTALWARLRGPPHPCRGLRRWQVRACKAFHFCLPTSRCAHHHPNRWNGSCGPNSTQLFHGLASISQFFWSWPFCKSARQWTGHPRKRHALRHWWKFHNDSASTRRTSCHKIHKGEFSNTWLTL